MIVAALLAGLIGGAGAAVETVANPRQAPAQRTVLYAELWRSGGPHEPLLGVIGDAVTDEQGGLYLLDTQLQQVVAFSAAGVCRGVVSRQGEGPGEIARVYDLLYLGGGRLGMLQTFPPRLIAVSSDGVPAGDIALRVAPKGDGGGLAALERLECRDGEMVGAGWVMQGSGVQQSNVEFVASFGPDGAERHCFGTHAGGYDFSRPIHVDETRDYFERRIWALGPGGELFVTAAREAYLIEVRAAASGALLRRIVRNWEPHRRSAAEKEAAKDNYSFSSNGELPPIRYDMAAYDPAISGLAVIGDELWVRRPEQERDLPAGVAYRCDVFDLHGRLQEERSVRVPGFTPGADRLLLLEDGRLAVIKGFRAAHAAAGAGLERQVGEHRVTSGSAGDAELQVIVYGPAAPARDQR
jgi:hypothetical protein